MAYSTIDEYKGNISVDMVKIEDIRITNRIAQADQDVQTDLSKIIDFSLVPADSSNATFPKFLNNLAQWKTCELCLVYVYGKKRNVKDNSDIDYWIQKYDKLIEAILNLEIPLELEDGTSIGGISPNFTQDSKSGIAPAFGSGPWGGFATEEDLEKARPLD